MALPEQEEIGPTEVDVLSTPQETDSEKFDEIIKQNLKQLDGGHPTGLFEPFIGVTNFIIKKMGLH